MSPNLERGPRETGRDGAFGHRMGGGIFNRDRPACTSVGKRSSVSPAGSSNPWTAKVLDARAGRRGDRIAVHFAAARFQRAPNDLFAAIFLLSGPAFDIVLRLFRTSEQ